MRFYFYCCILTLLFGQISLAGPTCQNVLSESPSKKNLESAIIEFHQLLHEYAQSNSLIKRRLESELQAKYNSLVIAGVNPSRLKSIPSSKNAKREIQLQEKQNEKSVLEKEKINPRTWQPLHNVKYPNAGYSTRLNFTLDSRSLIAFGPFYETVRVLDVETGVQKAEIKQSAELAINLTQSNEFLISTEKELMRIDLDSTGVEKKLWQIETGAESIKGAVYSSMKQKIYALLDMGDGKSIIYIIDPLNGEFQVRELDFTAYAIQIQDHKNPQIVLSVDNLTTQYAFLDSSTLKVTSISSTQDSTRYTSGLESLEFTQNPGQALVVSSVNGKAAIWDFITNKLVSDLGAGAKDKPFFHMGASSPATGLNVVLTFAHTLEFYSSQNKSLASLSVKAPRDPHALMLSPNGQFLIIVGEAGNALIVGSPLN